MVSPGLGDVSAILHLGLQLSRAMRLCVYMYTPESSWYKENTFITTHSSYCHTQYIQLNKRYLFTMQAFNPAALIFTPLLNSVYITWPLLHWVSSPTCLGRHAGNGTTDVCIPFHSTSGRPWWMGCLS